LNTDNSFLTDADTGRMLKSLEVKKFTI
jgi:hypothetical protein